MAKVKDANICIHIRPSLDTLELLQYNASKGSFVKLDAEQFAFDPSTRDLLEDVESLKLVLRRLYERNKIPLTHNTSLVVPAFFTRQYSMPESLESQDLNAVLMQEAEKFYVFKNREARIGYTPLSSGQILYTAYPKQSLDLIREAFSGLKIPLISIDCNYTAALRALVSMGVMREEIAQQAKWGLVMISDYAAFFAVVEGNWIEKIQESPLPMVETDESTILNEVTNDFQQFYGFEILNRLVVVNNSSKISSPALVESLQFNGTTTLFEQNENTLTSLGAQDAAYPCSLEAVGGSLVNLVPEIPALELGDPWALKASMDQKNSNVLGNILLILGVVSLLALVAGTLILGPQTEASLKESQRLQAEIQTTTNQFSIIPDVKRQQLVADTMLFNKKTSNLMLLVNKELPASAWLDKFEMAATSDLKVGKVDYQLPLFNLMGGAIPDASGNAPGQTLEAYKGKLLKYLGEGTTPLNTGITPINKEGKSYTNYIFSNLNDKNAIQFGQ
jgi:hypothetical protein